MQMKNWLDTSTDRELKAQVDCKTARGLGIVVKRGSQTATRSSIVQGVLVRDDSSAGWHFKTTYLIPEK